MEIIYCDSSAIAKLLLTEEDSDAVEALWLRPDTVFLSSDLIITELNRAVRRNPQRSASDVAKILAGLQTITITRDILYYAGEIRPLDVRTLDAIHLASAVALGDTLSGILTFDNRMRDAAEQLGLPVISV